MGIRGSVHAQRSGTGPHGSLLDSVELDKSWHGIHFLLSGGREPGSLAKQFLVGDTPLPNTGEAEVFHYRPAQVSAIDEVLRAWDADELAKRFDSARMIELDIYPSLVWNDEALEYLLSYYRQLRSFVSIHAAKANELLVIIC